MQHEPVDFQKKITPAATPSATVGAPRVPSTGSHGAAGSLLVARMGFTKLDEGILQSSIMAEDGNTFKVWITLIAACKQDGIARISPIFLSSICHIEIQDIDFILEKLASPDPHSRSTNDDGKRIERIDGGYRIINYHKYRNYDYSISKEAIRKRKYRERKINELNIINGTCPGHVHGHSASASASASVLKSDKEEDCKGGVVAGWRTDFVAYQADCEAGFNALHDNWEWIEEQRRYYPGCAIRRSLEKMYYQYWSLEAGWKNKKNHRTKALDWKRTIENAFGYKNNRVYWGKGEVDLEEVELNLRKERGNGTN